MTNRRGRRGDAEDDGLDVEKEMVPVTGVSDTAIALYLFCYTVILLELLFRPVEIVISGLLKGFLTVTEYLRYI